MKMRDKKPVVVVVGTGMAGARFVEELLAKVGKPAPRQVRWQQQRPTAQAA